MSKGENGLMSFGHRAYKTYDPKAKIFKRFVNHLLKRMRKYEIAEELRIKSFSEKHIYPKTDFYGA